MARPWPDQGWLGLQSAEEEALLVPTAPTDCIQSKVKILPPSSDAQTKGPKAPQAWHSTAPFGPATCVASFLILDLTKLLIFT